MPVIAMSRPWLRPEDGKFYLRKKTPQRYKALAGRAEFRIPLHTRDPKEATRRFPEAMAAWDAMVAAWDRDLNKETLTPDRAKDIAAQWAAWIASGRGKLNSDGVTGLMRGEPDTVADVHLAWLTGKKPSASTLSFDECLKAHADEALKFAGVSVTDDSLPMLLRAMRPAVRAAYTQARLEHAQSSGLPVVVPPLVALSRMGLPHAEPPPDPKAPDALPFDTIWEAWKTVTKTGPRTVHETRNMLRRLAEFLEHDDALRVTKADIIQWRTHLKGTGLNNNTWNNRISLVGLVFKQAVKDDRLPLDPTDGTRLEKTPNKSWLPYTDEEAATILRAARKETKPSLRWAHWIMAFSGMRVGEVLQLTRGDVEQDRASGITYIRVAPDESSGKAVKNGLVRNVPVHPALVSEGFLEFVSKVETEEAPLFPEKALDRFGRRGGRGWNLVGKWIRETVGITDRKKAPDHSWRHRIEDELRAAEVDESIRDAICGHQRKTMGKQYGIRGEALARMHRELSKVTLPPGL